MKKNQKLKLAGILLGAALSSSGAYAASGSCGAGKCGGEAKKMEKKSSCGAGKCGGDMKKDKGNMLTDMKEKKMEMAHDADKKAMDMKKDAKSKVEGSCGAGKCG